MNDSHIFVSFTGILLFGTKFQYSCKRRLDEERKQSDEAAHFLFHNAQRPTKESETLDACIRRFGSGSGYVKRQGDTL